MKKTDFISDPHIQFLHQILADLDRGTLSVPRFQRPLTWNLDRRLELLQSVRDGIPCGSILIWKTNKELSCYETLGPFRLPASKQKHEYRYLMDGFQRLSTLFAALYEMEMSEDADLSDRISEDALTFYYDLEVEDFVSASKVDESKRLRFLPLRILLDSIKLLQFQRQIPPEKAEDWIPKADLLAEAFRLYKIPIIPIITDDLEMATLTFQRVNRQGVPMSDLHMVHTLAFSGDFDFLKEIEELRDSTFAPLAWEELNEDWILKALKARFDLDILGNKDVKALSDRLKREPEALPEAAKCLTQAIHFLDRRCGVPSPYWVPYGLHMVLLAEAFRHEPEPSAEVEALLESWFWLTTLGGFFAGISGHRLGRVHEDIVQIVKLGNPSWSFQRDFQYESLPPKVDFRAVRIKALALRRAQAQRKMGRDLLAHRNSALAHLFPVDLLSKDSYASPGNRVLADGDQVAGLQERLSAGRGISKPRTEPDMEEVRQRSSSYGVDFDRHIITAQARKRLEKSADAFVAQRVQDLEEDERQFIRPHALKFGF